MDNPILTSGFANGFLRRTGEVQLQWEKRAEAANGYTVKYRKLGDRPRSALTLFRQIPHSDIAWPDHSDWPYYQQSDLPAPIPVEQPASTTVTATIRNPTEGELYAIRINYDTGRQVTPGGPSTGKKVFSAREAFIWPSDNLPGSGERVATYPFFGHHQNREFTYIICDTTFPDPDTTTPDNEWMEIIIGAFKQWEVATSEFVTVAHDSAGSCASGPLEDFIVSDDAQSEVRMVETDNLVDFLGFNEIKSDVFKVCALFSEACATSFTGYSGISTDDGDRLEFQLSLLNLGRLLLNLEGPLVQLQELLTNRDRQAKAVLQSVDVTFNQHYKDERGREFYRPSNVIVPSDVNFNKCTSIRYLPTDDPDANFNVYSTAVHEAGHALGLSDISDLEWWQPSHVAHATIPDAAMNYDKESRHLYDPGGVDNPGTDPDERWTRYEPDCSPHPFDVMAVFALYQTVPVVSVTGPTTGVEGDRIRLTSSVSGGVGPYTYSWSSLLAFSTDPHASSVNLTLPQIDVPDLDWPIELVVRDSRGLEARTEILITTVDS